MAQQLEHKFSVSFETNIWEIRASDHGLLVTTRDSESMQVRFSLFDLNRREFLWKDISFEEPWWISVYHFSRQIIVFQTYQDTQNIESRSLFGFNIDTMEAIWSVEEVSVKVRSEQLLELTPLEGHEEGSYLINIETGALVGDQEKLQGVDTSDVADQTLSRHYEVDSKYFETLSEFLSKKVGFELEGSCDYLETSDFFVISANSRTKTGYNLDLFVFDHGGRLLLQESLDSDMKGLATGSFFIVGQALIFVQGKRNLVFYSF